MPQSYSNEKKCGCWLQRSFTVQNRGSPCRTILGTRLPRVSTASTSHLRQEAGRPLFFLAAFAESVSCLTCSSVKRFSLELAAFAALDRAPVLDGLLLPADPLPLLDAVPLEVLPELVLEDIAGISDPYRTTLDLSRLVTRTAKLRKY